MHIQRIEYISPVDVKEFVEWSGDYQYYITLKTV
jgi:hypothetical protein